MVRRAVILVNSSPRRSQSGNTHWNGGVILVNSSLRRCQSGNLHWNSL